MMKPRPVRMAPGAVRHIREEKSNPIGPQRMLLNGAVYWVTGASGHAVCSVTPVDVPDADAMSGRLSVMVMAEPPAPDIPEGIALLRTMSPDEADQFADALKKTAAQMRDRAAEQAQAALRKAAGR